MARATVGRLALVLLACLVSVTPARGQTGETVALFNGKDLDGWHKVGGGATYRVENGEIVGEVGPGPNTFLRTDKTYADFRLELDARFDVPGNSGVQFRSHQRPGANGRVYGYQFEMDPSPRAWSGGIYDEAARGWLFPLTDHPEAQKAFKLNDWNHFVIEARGPVLRTEINGVPCANLIDPVESEGFIALQVHQGKAGRIRWKNIRLTDYGTPARRDLFNGKNLDGWHASGGGHWKVEEGAIHGASSTAEKHHGHLFTDESYHDFAVTLQFKPVKGDSGLYFRSGENGASGVVGIQANIDPEKDTGGLYEIDGRGWLARPLPADIKKVLKPGEWNTLSVVAIRGHIVVHVNGRQTAEIRDAASRPSGPLALQVHAAQDVDVWFKDIRILPIDSAR
ncbi:MAG: DUF1080 domain-containing protein [Isosphaeraceae bacterium]